MQMYIYFVLVNNKVVAKRVEHCVLSYSHSVWGPQVHTPRVRS